MEFFKPLNFHGRASRDLHLFRFSIQFSEDFIFRVDKFLKKKSKNYKNILKFLFLF